MGRIAWAFFRRDFLLTISYRGAFLLQQVGIIFGVPVLYFMSKVMEGGQSETLAQYGGKYFPFLLLGVAFTDFITVSQSSFTTSIREHQFMGTLEIVMLSPTPVPVILLFSSLWGYFFTSIRFVIYLLCGFLFGLDLSNANVLPFLAILLISIASMASLGILIAAVTLVIKRSEGINMLMTGMTLAFGGVAYPVTLLPDWLQWVPKVIPYSYALKGMRLSLLQGAGFAEVLPLLTTLAWFSFILLPIGLYSFSLATRYAKLKGTLGQY
jgi:ABC-2 type transport system permease protein